MFLQSCVRPCQQLQQSHPKIHWIPEKPELPTALKIIASKNYRIQRQTFVSFHLQLFNVTQKKTCPKKSKTTKHHQVTVTVFLLKTSCFLPINKGDLQHWTSLCNFTNKKQLLWDLQTHTHMWNCKWNQHYSFLLFSTQQNKKGLPQLSPTERKVLTKSWLFSVLLSGNTNYSILDVMLAALAKI